MATKNRRPMEERYYAKISEKRLQSFRRPKAKTHAQVWHQADAKIAVDRLRNKEDRVISGAELRKRLG